MRECEREHALDAHEKERSGERSIERGRRRERERERDSEQTCAHEGVSSLAATSTPRKRARER